MGLTQRITPKTFTRTTSDVFLVQGGTDANGKKAWYFVRVQSPKIKAFLAAAKQGHLDIGKFGELLVSGFGHTPPAHIVDLMRKSHGYIG